jgi:hypothetical protein
MHEHLNFADQVGRQLMSLTDEQRVQFFDVLTANFCPDCGRVKEAGETCHCTNDD